MKLKSSNWKQAWFDSHISERFFQEMGRLEKGAVLGLETSAQWTEQIMIEVGALAQMMIRLEQPGASEPQIHQAYEKALRLAALGLHLLTALDGVDRQRLRSASIVHGDAEAEPLHAVVPTFTPAPMHVPPVAAPAAAAPASHSPAAPAAKPAAMMPPRGPVPLRKPVGAAPATQSEPAATAGTEGVPSTPLFSSLLQVAGRNTPRSESAVHQTILALSTQGLSRAEIEVVTGEPRHVIEAVLNHDRERRIAAARNG